MVKKLDSRDMSHLYTYVDVLQLTLSICNYTYMSAFCAVNVIWTSTCLFANTADQDYISASEEFIITSATSKAIELQTSGQSNQLQSSYLH